MGKLWRFHLDYETFSELDLKEVGSDRYSRDESTEVLMAAYARADEPVKHWDAQQQPMPAELEDALLDDDCVKFAWNAPFEMQITQNTLGIPVRIKSWRDTMMMAMSLSLPGSLGKAGAVVDLPEDKQKNAEGKALMRVFSSPRKPTKRNPDTRVYWWQEPEKWERYCVYNVDDVEAERAIYHKIRRWNPSAEEWQLWFIDQEINQAGIPINMEMVDNANEIFEYIKADRLRQMQEITKLDNPASTTQLLPWMQARGYPFEDCQKGHIVRARESVNQLIASNQPLLITQHGTASEEEVAQIGQQEVPANDASDLERVLELRLEAAKSAPAKYAALQRAADRKAGVIRNTLQFYGAQRTGRWGGRIYQPQNLAKPEKYLEKHIEEVAYHLEYMSPEAMDQVYAKPMDALAAGVRPAAQAPEGYLFADADLNAIENRGLGWVANCPKILNVFELKRDPYVDFATHLFPGGTYEEYYAEYKAGDGRKRTISKPGVLGCGYQLGPGKQIVNYKTGEIEATGLLGYAWNMGIKDFTEEQSALSVKVFRETFEEVPDFWYGIEREVKRAILTGKNVKWGLFEFRLESPFLLIVLPSGRPLYYVRPRIEEVMAPWGEKKPTITYEGLNDKNQWVRISTHGGKLTENVVQAISRDLLAHGIKLAKRDHGLDIRLHVHDQIVALVKEERAAEELEILQDCMGVNPWWSLARDGFPDLPLGSAGFTSKVFMKD